MEFEIGGRSFLFFAEERQWKKLIAMFQEYVLHPAVIGAVLLMVAGIGLYIYAKRNHKNRLTERIKEYAPLFYLFFMFSVSLFNQTPGIRQDFHFQFDYVLEGTTTFHETRILLVILYFLYFIPFGMLLQWQKGKWNLYRAFVLVLFVGFIIEASKYLFACGIGATEHWVACGLGGAFGILLVHTPRKIKDLKRVRMHRKMYAPKRSAAINLAENGQ